MVPVFRMGLSPFIVNPFSGYIMVMKMIGRKSGRTRWVPVNYTIYNGNVYCISAFGEKSHWYHNLKANPNIDIFLPGRAIAGYAEIMKESDAYLFILRQILKNSGAAAFMDGINPFSISDQALVEKTKEMVVFQIHPTGIANGPLESSGWGWILLNSIWIFLILYWISK
jgi:deazaflavin-dependent oxidoreductase (nitroreductase family)